MDKNFTLLDLQIYYQELSQISPSRSGQDGRQSGPSPSVLQNLLRYSGALNVLKTKSAGVICQLVN